MIISTTNNYDQLLKRLSRNYKLSGNFVSDIGLERTSVILMLLTTSPARLILTSLFYKIFNLISAFLRYLQRDIMKS